MVKNIKKENLPVDKEITKKLFRNFSNFDNYKVKILDNLKFNNTSTKFSKRYSVIENYNKEFKLKPSKKNESNKKKFFRKINLNKKLTEIAKTDQILESTDNKNKISRKNFIIKNEKFSFYIKSSFSIKKKKSDTKSILQKSKLIKSKNLSAFLKISKKGNLKKIINKMSKNTLLKISSIK